MARWRGEVNVPALTQLRPDLLVRVSCGALGSGAYFIEYERRAVRPWAVNHKLRSYHRMASAYCGTITLRMGTEYLHESLSSLKYMEPGKRSSRR